jgi:lipoate synthase
MVLRYVTPENFKMFEQAAKEMGYSPVRRWLFCG